MTSGCTVYAALVKPSGTAPSHSPASGASDVQQIRGLVAKIGQALGDLDLFAANALTCTRYQVASRGADELIVPSINSWKGVEQALVYNDKAVLSGEVSLRFPAATASQVASLIEAIIGRDHDTYATTALQMIRQSITVSRFTVDGVSVVSDSAVGEITATISTDGRSQTVTEPVQFQRDRDQDPWLGGPWQYCQKAPPGILSRWLTAQPQR
ncbi:hypothetical protein [Mycobacteroides abscessus]|nr:hypothetical protein [Mycobacteroides abscessus]